MPVARLSFPAYQSSNENGGGNHAWQNVSGAGSSASGAGAFDTRDPNSADMNWIRSYGDGSRGGASIPTGSIIKGIVVGFQATQPSGSQSGGTYDVSIFKNGSAVASKTGSLSNGGSIGPFGSSVDLWGLGATATPAFFSTGIYFGLHLNFPTITSNITFYAWNGYMDIYYDDPTPVASSISVGAGNNQSAQISTQFGQQLYAIVKDQGGNPMAGVSVTFTMPASGATARFNSVGGSATATAVTNSSGGAVSPFFYANGTAGSYNPVADVTGSSPLIYTLFNATNTNPPVTLVPTTMSVIQGNGQQAAVLTTFNTQLKVKVFDQFGAAFPNADIRWTAPGSGASGTYQGGNPGQSFSDASGVATAPALTANNTAGAWSATATAFGTAVTQGFNLTNLANNSPPTPTSLQYVQGANQGAALSANFALTMKVKVLDQYGSAYAGATCNATLPGSTYGTWLGGSGNVKTAVSDASGIADFGTVTASSTARASWAIAVACAGTGGVSITNLNNVDVTVVAAVSAVSGGGQTTPTSSSFASALKARATNGLGGGVQNVNITFTAPGTAASCRFAGSTTQVVATDVNGDATSAVPVATSTTGSYTVTATAPGVVGFLAPTTYGTIANFPLINGAQAYLPEVCLPTLESPGSASTFGAGTGSPVSPWLSPTQAVGNPGSSTIYATNVQQPPTANRSQQLLFNPAPASWAAIKNDALITKLFFQCWGRGLPNGGTLGDLLLSFIKNGNLHPNFSQIPYVGWGNGSFAQLGVSQFNPPTTGINSIVGADLKNSNTGYGLAIAPSAGTVPGGGFNINGAVMRVCYQDVDKSNLIVSIPLQVCHF